MTHHQHRAKVPFGQVGQNAIKIELDTAKQCVDVLNVDLANCNVLYHQIKKHHWVVQGAEFYQLHKLLEKQYEGLDKQIDLIAERITVLGGVPVASPAKIQEMAHIQSEPDGIFDLRDMLNNDLRSYQVCIARLREHCALCRQIGDFGTAHLLEEVLFAQEGFCHDVEMTIAQESLARATVATGR